MRQLRSCDFCGEEAAGVYEVVPAELAPAEGEQRRVVLCADCRETLEGVLAPLLSRLGIEESNAEPAVESEADAAGASPTDADVAPTDSFAADDPRGTSISESSGSDIPDLGTGETADNDGDDEKRDEVGGDEREGGDVRDADVAAGGTDAGGGDDDALPPLDGDGESEPPAGGSVADVDAGSEPTPAPEEEPAEFRTVMRLLGNREFPVARGEIVELATSAYGLGEGEVDEILAYAVERGLLEDDGETLQKA